MEACAQLDETSGQAVELTSSTRLSLKSTSYNEARVIIALPEILKRLEVCNLTNCITLYILISSVSLYAWGKKKQKVQGEGEWNGKKKDTAYMCVCLCIWRKRISRTSDYLLYQLYPLYIYIWVSVNMILVIGKLSQISASLDGFFIRRPSAIGCNGGGEYLQSDFESV